AGGGAILAHEVRPDQVDAVGAQGKRVPGRQHADPDPVRRLR
ncbi:MAG: hypothetical protein JWP42_2496, partial [Pseudomonas sp.]|nr:hypothetical protein [Pseudomonas sp.]